MHGNRLLAAGATLLAACTAALASAGACAGARTAHAAGASAPRCRGASLRPSRANARTVDAAMLCLIDGVRARHGLPALRVDRRLARVAGAKVSEMVHRDYFADDSPSGQTPMSQVASAGYSPHAAVGQNIGWGTGTSSTPAHVVAEWIASRAHLEVLLDDQYRDAGVAATPAVPAVVKPSGAGATYAIELAAR